MHRIQPEDRRFYSTVLLFAAAPAICFGWFFWMAGTGQYLVLSGLAMAVAGVALAPTVRRATAAVAACAIGCWPIVFLTLWAIL